MYKSRRKLLSQNFLHSHSLVSQLVRNSSLGENDTVIEIGPGKGIITQALLHLGATVLAVELDDHLNPYLTQKFANNPRFILYGNNFLDSPLPLTPYKVFANLPFAIEGEAVRKLIDAGNPPLDCYLIVRKDFAYRLGGIQTESMFSLMHKPWFDFSIYHQFKHTDFIPAPRVQAVMLRFTKRESPLIPWKEKISYQKFIQIGFGQGLPVRQNLRKYYAQGVIDTAFYRLSLRKDIRPSFMTFEQWRRVYGEIAG